MSPRPDLMARILARAAELRAEGCDATEAGVQAALEVLEGTTPEGAERASDEAIKSPGTDRPRR